MIAYFTAHPGVVAAASAFIVGVIDLAMALSPNLAGNGILHSALVFFTGKATPPVSK